MSPRASKSLRHRLLATVLVMPAALAGCSTASPPDTSEGVPIVNDSGTVVGTADPEDISSARASNGVVPVYDDEGTQVGNFTPEGGFTPAEE